MKRLVVLIEVDDIEQQQLFYDIMQEMIEARALCGYFTLVDDGDPVDDLPDYMEYERKDLIPAIVKHERPFIYGKSDEPNDNDNL